jgi:biopolymer transport protein ExbD
MAEPRKFLDVWIIETNTVYQEVPFTVVADWVQQGRLLEDDKVKPSGTAEWFRVGGMPSFHAYLPRAEPFRVEDKAEALEPVHLDFAWKRRPGDDEEDVDMIPLIDISLVLLIFFMMTATVAVSGGLNIDLPETAHGVELDSSPQSVWIGIDLRDGVPVYSIGEGDAPAAEAERDLLEEQVLQALDERVQANGPAEVRINAHRQLPYEVVKKVTVEVEKRHRKGQVKQILAQVNEKSTGK